MSAWSNAVSAVAKQAQTKVQPFVAQTFETEVVDWDRLVTLDFETFYSSDYTLRKLTTSEYIRDPQFLAQMVGIKVGRKPTKIVLAKNIASELSKIPWSTHALLAHHAQFDGFILGHHFGVFPAKTYCTLSMARGLHSNDIGAGLDEVAQFYGKGNKLPGALEAAKGIRQLPPALIKQMSAYCANDVELTLEIFKEMLPKMPKDEMDIIDITCRLFNKPLLKVDVPRVEVELVREIAERERILLSTLGPPDVADALIKGHGKEVALEAARKKIAGGESFADLLRQAGVEPPKKISPAYFKHKDEAKKYAYAFAKTDLAFTALQEHTDPVVRTLVEARLSVKSTINKTRAERFLTAGAGGAALPVYLRYFGAHTGRWSAGNGMNMQNLPRDGELRKSILAPKGEVIVVADSGQIEARVNAWLWGQEDLIEGFRLADQGLDRDVYCKFADTIYGRTITKADDLERFVGKVGILGLGYQMGAHKLQSTLAIGAMGPAVHLDLTQCQTIVNAYRRKNSKIREGWKICEGIIKDLSEGKKGSYRCISWGDERIYLPNGMCLKYPGIQDKRVIRMVARKMDPTITFEESDQYPEWVYTRKGIETKIYGGLVNENIVQALARIIVGKQLLAIDKKYPVVMTTHDEVTALAKKAQGQRAYDWMLGEMRKAPDWCKDIPLNAEGKFAAYYAK